MSTPHLPAPWAIRVRRAASVGLSISTLALSLVSAVPLGMLVLGMVAPGGDHPDVSNEVRELAVGCLGIAIVSGAFALMLAAGTTDAVVPRSAVPLRFAVAALVSAGASMVLAMLPTFLFVASLLLSVVMFW